MALQFPTTPAPNVGDKYTPPGLNKTWEWTGTVWKLLPRALGVSDITGLETELDNKQDAGDYATLVGGVVPATQLPSFVDDVVEYDSTSLDIPADSTTAAPEKNRPTTGEKGKIYVDTVTKKTYRWGGAASGYVEISASPGTTDDVPEGVNNLYYKDSLASAAAPVQSVNGQTGAVTLTTADIGGLDTLVAGGSQVTANFTVINVEQGSYKHGDTVASGTSLETVIKKMLQKQIAAVYVSPSLSISTTATKNVEYGTSVTPTIEGSYTQGNAGLLTQYRIKEDGNVVRTTTAIEDYISPSFTVTTNKVFRAEANYGTGPQLTDNFGQNSGTPIQEITNFSLLSNTITFAPVRGIFYGADDKDFVANDSQKVRQVSSPYLNLAKNSTFEIAIQAGDSRVTIAYPASLGAIQYIRHEENGMMNVLDTFRLNTVAVEGANNSTSITYNVYTWPLNFATSIPFNGNNTFHVKL
jgi:hypothetical protein